MHGNQSNKPEQPVAYGKRTHTDWRFVLGIMAMVGVIAIYAIIAITVYMIADD